MKNRLKQYSIIVLGTGLLAISAVHAASSLTMMPSAKVIANLEQTVKEIKAKSQLPVLFPAEVPAPASGKKYYASGTVRPDGGYYISIDATPECNGAKYCTVGSVMADLGKRPQIYSAPGGHDITQVVRLYEGKKGFYTPAHAEADYWPTMVEWRVGNVLYDLSWKLQNKNEKKIILTLVNSALQKGVR